MTAILGISAFDRGIVQAAQIWRGNKEGGFFLLIGRKKNAEFHGDGMR